MTAAYPVRRKFTPEEYLMLERNAQEKSEYLCGEIYAMAGGSPNHNILAANIGGEFYVQLRGKPCRTYNSDQKVRTGREGLFTYPDVTIGCDKPIYYGENEEILTNPTVIVEVLSPSTAHYDRTTKFAFYREIPSLTDYLLVHQDTPCIEHYARKEANQWLLTVAKDLDAKITLSELDVTLPLSAVYSNVDFSEESN